MQREALREPVIVHPWYSGSIPMVVGSFDAKEATDFVNAVDEFRLLGRAGMTDAYESMPFWAHDAVCELAAAEFILSRDLHGLVIKEFVRWNLAVPLTAGESPLIEILPSNTYPERVVPILPPTDVPNSFFDHPYPSYEEEARAIGVEPFDIETWSEESLVVSIDTLRDLLEISSSYGFQPENKDWRSWLQAYAYLYPEREHIFFSGFMHQKSFSRADSQVLSGALQNAISDDLARLRRVVATNPRYYLYYRKLLNIDRVALQELQLLSQKRSISWHILSNATALIYGD